MRADVLLIRLERAVGAGGTLLEPEDAFAQIVAPTGELLASSPHRRPAAAVPDLLAEVEGPEFLNVVVLMPEEPVDARLLIVPVSGGRVLLVGASLDEVDEALGRLRSSVHRWSPRPAPRDRCRVDDRRRSRCGRSIA